MTHNLSNHDLGNANHLGEHNSELDSHADTCVIGGQAVILREYPPEHSVDVTPFLARLGTVARVPMCSAAVAFDDPRTGNAHLLVFHQALSIPELNHNLLCPMQMRHNGVIVNERPKHCTEDPTVDDHAILHGDLRMTLQLDGPTSYFPTRTPTDVELECYPNGPFFEMTGEFPEWDPHTDLFQILESRLVDSDGEIITKPRRNTHQLFSMLTVAQLVDPFCKLCTTVNIPHVTAVARSQVTSHRDNAALLASTWRIGLPAARHTLRATTQRGVREYDGQARTVERRYPTGDRPLRYKRLLHPVFNDTFFSTVESRRGNTASHIYATDFGWSRNFPIKSKSDAHETLDEFFHCYGVPSRLINDNAKELIQGKFASVARQAHCHMDLTDPYSPFQNRAESEIREIKWLAGQWMAANATPNRLWDYCTVLASLVRSHTQLSLYQLHGQAPEEMMTGVTPDISHICEFCWFEWVYVSPPVGSFADGKEHLGRYLGPTLPGHGSTMSYHVLQHSGEVVSRTSIRKLTPQELDKSDIRCAMDKFMDNVEDKLGPPIADDDTPILEATEAASGKKKRKAKSKPRHPVSVSSLNVNSVTPEYELYEDDNESHQHQQDPDDFDIDAYDGYVTAQVSLPREEKLELGTVLRRKRDAEGKLIGHSHENPIMDSSIYDVVFSDGEVLEYSANVIAENLYSQVDDEGHHQVMIDNIIDHKKDSTAVPIEDRTFKHKGKTRKRITTRGWVHFI